MGQEGFFGKMPPRRKNDLKISLEFDNGHASIVVSSCFPMKKFGIRECMYCTARVVCTVCMREGISCEISQQN